MKRYHAIRALAAASVAVLLAACGGGDDDGATANVDISGVWQNTSGGFVYALNGVTYGYQIEGQTIRYFRGASYAATGNSFSFANGRYHEGAVNTVVTTANERTGSFAGNYLPSSDDITLSFTTATTNTFDDMTVKYQAIGNTAQSLLDYEGTYTIATGVTVVLDATSATSGTLVGTAVNGCNFNGSITRTRGDRNVWAVSLTQSSCTVDATRNGETSTGLATVGTSNTTKLLRVLSFDGKAWNRIETQK